jgi:hypothetical protein
VTGDPLLGHAVGVQPAESLERFAALLRHRLELGLSRLEARLDRCEVASDVLRSGTLI